MTHKENLLRAIRRQGPGWVPYRYDGSLTLLSPPVCVRPLQGGVDDWGVRWIQTTPTEGSYVDNHPAIRLGELESFRPPETDWEQVTAGLAGQVRERQGQDTLLISYDEMVLFDRAQALLSTEEFLVAVAAMPEKVDRLLGRIADYQKRLTRAIMRSGVAGVRFTDDWGMQTSLFIPPELWRQLVKPRLKELYAIVKEHGGLVFQHSCGHIGEIVPDLVELGLDVLDPCQPAANDIFGWKRDYGERLSFMGGLDTQSYLSFGTPEQVRGQVARVLAVMSREGGYIAAPSHTIHIPEENRRAMSEAIAEFNARAGSGTR
jgi:uroporphyrinogen decarboxylase